MKKLSVIIELPIGDNSDTDQMILDLKKKLGANILDRNEVLVNPNIVAWSDKVNFLEQINQAVKFKDYLELHQSVLSVGISMYNDDVSVPSSLGTDFSLDRAKTSDIVESKEAVPPYVEAPDIIHIS